MFKKIGVGLPATPLAGALCLPASRASDLCDGAQDAAGH